MIFLGYTRGNSHREKKIPISSGSSDYLTGLLDNIPVERFGRCGYGHKRPAENARKPDISHAWADKKRYMKSANSHLRLEQPLNNSNWTRLLPINYSHGL